MSFGSAAARRRRRIPIGDPCPCGSGARFRACCGPVLEGAPAATPEALMRSRYAAFALGDLTHLEASWHPATRPERLTVEDGLEWAGLEVLSAHEDGARATVEFRAHWRDPAAGTSGDVHETSRFRYLSGRWLYVDGDVDGD